MNHNTIDANTKMYIDNVERIENGHYKVTGWIYNNTSNVVGLYVGEIKSEDRIGFTLFPRADVQRVYPEMENINVGVIFYVPADKLNSNMWVTLADGNQCLLSYSLQSWAITYTKFNRTHKDLIIVDNFYKDPDLIRNYAMNSLNFQNSNYHKGKRSSDRFIVEGTKEKFEEIIGRKVVNWNHANYANGVFQYCTPLDPIVYHVDTQTYAAMVFLTPDAPLETGTAFYKSKYTGATEFEEGTFSDELFQKTFKGLSNELNFYDSTQYELMDTAANVYNRLVLFNAKRIHAATKYFGDAIENARFFQLFFFDVE